jgi:hypothetical protein
VVDLVMKEEAQPHVSVVRLVLYQEVLTTRERTIVSWPGRFVSFDFSHTILLTNTLIIIFKEAIPFC